MFHIYMKLVNNKFDLLGWYKLEMPVQRQRIWFQRILKPRNSFFFKKCYSLLMENWSGI